MEGTQVVNVIASAASTAEYPTWLVCVLGVGIVFLGLICLILLCYVMSGIVRGTEKNASSAPAPVSAIPAPAANAMSAEEKGRVIAAISCAVAEELGTNPEAIRITSIKRV